MNKTSTWIAVAALACSTAAFSQTHESDRAAQRDADARTETRHDGHAGAKLKDSMHRLGDKTRNAMHRMGSSMHRTARRADDHATRDARRSDDRVEHDSRAMGVAGERTDVDSSRRQRMDESYDAWKNRQQR